MSERVVEVFARRRRGKDGWDSSHYDGREVHLVGCFDSAPAAPEPGLASSQPLQLVHYFEFVRSVLHTSAGQVPSCSSSCVTKVAA